MGTESRKPRATTLNFAFQRPTAITSYRISASGEIELFSGAEKAIPAKSEIRASYDRKKAPKLLNVSPLPPDAINFHPDIALASFDLLFAVDTNTVQTVTGPLSVSCIVLCKFRTAREAQFAPMNCLEFRNVVANQEQFAWKKTIELICANPSYKPTISVGLVVDCDLGKLERYDSRAEPIFQDFVLPLGFTLLYATSDSGKDYLANRLIGECDSQAKRLIGFLLKGDISKDTFISSPKGEPSIRIWLPK